MQPMILCAPRRKSQRGSPENGFICIQLQWSLVTWSLKDIKSDQRRQNTFWSDLITFTSWRSRLTQQSANRFNCFHKRDIKKEFVELDYEKSCLESRQSCRVTFWFDEPNHNQPLWMSCVIKSHRWSWWLISKNCQHREVTPSSRGGCFINGTVTSVVACINIIRWKSTKNINSPIIVAWWKLSPV